MWNLILYFMIWLPTVFGSQTENALNQHQRGEYPASGMLLGSKDMLLYVVFLKLSHSVSKPVILSYRFKKIQRQCLLINKGIWLSHRSMNLQIFLNTV